MSLKGGPHKGPVKLSEGMVAIDVPPSAPASDYAPLEYVEETKACGCVTTAAPGQTTTRLCAEHGGAVRSHTTAPHLRILADDALAALDLTDAAELAAKHHERGGTSPRFDLMEWVRENKGDLVSDLAPLETPTPEQLAEFHDMMATDLGVPVELLTGYAPAGLDGGER